MDDDVTYRLQQVVTWIDHQQFGQGKKTIGYVIHPDDLGVEAPDDWQPAPGAMWTPVMGLAATWSRLLVSKPDPNRE